MTLHFVFDCRVYNIGICFGVFILNFELKCMTISKKRREEKRREEKRREEKYPLTKFEQRRWLALIKCACMARTNLAHRLRLALAKCSAQAEHGLRPFESCGREAIETEYYISDG